MYISKVMLELEPHLTLSRRWRNYKKNCPQVLWVPEGLSSLRPGLFRDPLMADGVYLSLSCTTNLQTLETRLQSGSMVRG